MILVIVILLVWFAMGLIGVVLDIKYSGAWGGELTVGLALFAMVMGIGPFAIGIKEFISNKYDIFGKVIYTPKGK